MKGFPIRKRRKRTKTVLPEVRPHLPKPDLPLRMFWRVHKVEGFYMDWTSQDPSIYKT